MYCQPGLSPETVPLLGEKSWRSLVWRVQRQHHNAQFHQGVVGVSVTCSCLSTARAHTLMQALFKAHKEVLVYGSGTWLPVMTVNVMYFVT